jgi:hypothetical protein
MQYPKWFDRLIKKDVDSLSESVTIGSDLPPLSEVEAFMRNTVWKYISDTIDFRIKSARDDIEDQNMDLETIRVNQGRIEELRFIGSLPKFVIDSYTQLKDEIDAKKAAENTDEPKKEEKSWVRS